MQFQEVKSFKYLVHIVEGYVMTTYYTNEEKAIFICVTYKEGQIYGYQTRQIHATF